MTGPLRILSLGGGTQSCALALMSAAGDLPRLDHVVFADTQGELPETYEYLGYLRGVLDAAAIPLHVVTAGSLETAMLSGASTVANPTPPAHVLNPDGTKGRIVKYRCSYDYKRLIVERQVKKLCGKRGDWKRSEVEQWLGFSLDETHRLKDPTGCRCGHNRAVRKGKKWVQIHAADGCTRCACTTFHPWLVNRWPLVEMRMRRADTIRWFAANGHPTPPRSACWFCPNSGNQRWQNLRRDHPDLFERACVIDETLRGGSSQVTIRGNNFKGDIYLHGTLAPLRTADLRTNTQVRSDAGELPLFDADAWADCDSGTCGT